MTGSIQIKKGRSNYYAVLNIYDNDGKRKLKWIDTKIPIKGNNKRKADAKLTELLAMYTASGVNLNRDVEFTDFMEQWLETMKATIAPTSYDAYKMILDVHILPYFAKTKQKVTDVSPAHIQKYVNEKLKVLSPNTVRKHLANLSKCFDSAVKQNIIAYNPVKRIEAPKKVVFTGAKHYNEKQIEQLLECSKNDPLELVIRLTLFYGLRRSEVLGLKWNAIDFDAGTVTIRHTVVKTATNLYKHDRTKNNSSHTVFPMTDILASELKKWKIKQCELMSLQPSDYVDSDYICTYADGRLILPDFVSRHFKLLLKKNNMPPIRFHDLRHSSAYYLKGLGFDLKDIQTWLRHSDIGTTMNIYVNLDMDAKVNIANKLNTQFQNLKMATS